MSRKLSAVLFIAAGLAMIAASTAWTRLAPPASKWSAEQQAAYDQAIRQYGQAVSQPEQDLPPGELDQATQQYTQLRNQRQAALGGRVWLGMVLQMLGVGLGLVGAIKLIVLQNQAADERAQRG